MPPRIACSGTTVTKAATRSIWSLRVTDNCIRWRSSAQSIPVANWSVHSLFWTKDLSPEEQVQFFVCGLNYQLSTQRTTLCRSGWFNEGAFLMYRSTAWVAPPKFVSLYFLSTFLAIFRHFSVNPKPFDAGAFLMNRESASLAWQISTSVNTHQHRTTIFTRKRSFFH